MDIFHSLWNSIEVLANRKIIYSSIKVREEIDKGNDELGSWCDEHLPKDFFLPFTSQTKYASLMDWANHSNIFSAPAKQEFAIVADAFIVATAADLGMKVVTFEVSDPRCRKRVKIPDACVALGVEYCSLNDLFRELGVIV